MASFVDGVYKIHVRIWWLRCTCTRLVTSAGPSGSNFVTVKCQQGRVGTFATRSARCGYKLGEDGRREKMVVPRY